MMAGDRRSDCGATLSCGSFFMLCSSLLESRVPSSESGLRLFEMAGRVVYGIHRLVFDLHGRGEGNASMSSPKELEPLAQGRGMIVVMRVTSTVIVF
jgi:hypothetical protein